MRNSVYTGANRAQDSVSAELESLTITATDPLLSPALMLLRNPNSVRPIIRQAFVLSKLFLETMRFNSLKWILHKICRDL